MWGETADFNNSFNEFNENYQGVFRHKNPISYVNRALDLLKEFQFRAVQGLCKEDEIFIYEEFVEELQLHQNLFDTYIDYDLSQIEAWEDFIEDKTLRRVQPFETNYSFDENETIINSLFEQYESEEISLENLLSALKNPVFDYQHNASNLSNNAFFNHYVYTELGKLEINNPAHDLKAQQFQAEKQQVAAAYLSRLQQMLDLEIE